MIRVFKNNVQKDFLRDNQGFRGYGLQIGSNRVPLQIYGAYSSDLAISSFKLNRIDSGNEVIESLTLSNDLIKFDTWQYLIDKTKLFEITIPEGVYFYEFSNGFDVYCSEIFKIQFINLPFMASSSLLASSSKLITDSFEV